jgi:small-conductance mechanosensitive channel
MRKGLTIGSSAIVMWVLAASALAAAPPSATNAASITLTAQQAREALEVLNDPQRRAQLEDTLRAIAAAGALNAPFAASAPTVSNAASAPAAVNGAASPMPATIRPNGLVSQLVRQAANWAAQAGLSLRHSLFVLLDTSSVRRWWTELFNSPSERAAFRRLAWTLCGALLPALALSLFAQIVLYRVRSRTVSVSAPTAEIPAHALLLRLPRALVNLLLNLAPLAIFVIAAIVMMSLLSEAGEAPDRALDALIDIYVIARSVVILSTFLLRPDDAQSRLLRISDYWARFLHRWIILITSVIAAGSALLDVAVSLGLSNDADLALMKVVALIGHVLISILILQCRRPVGAYIRAKIGGRQTLRMLGNAVADSWAFLAVFIVMALWFVWALDVRHGYRVLLHLGGESLAILIAARLVSIVAAGALARLFNAQQDHASGSLWQQHAYRYYPGLRRLLSWLLTFITTLLLLRIWGVDVHEWFQSGTVTHRLTSTLMTIAVVAIIGLIVWEWVNVAVEYRLDRWTKANDLARAARLRTLVPMLRGALLLAIAPVVVLTALSDLGVNIAPLVAGASIFGVALGFGSQKLVQDFITGIFLLLDNAMQVGDWVTLAGVSGTVEHLSIRTVRLRGGDGSVYTVPFSSVSTVNNTNRGLGNAAVKVNVAYGQNIDLAIATLKEIGAALRQDPKFKDGILSDFSFWGVDQLDGAAVTLSGQVECLDSTRWDVQREFNRRILDLFRERGIEIANPQRSVLLTSAPGRVANAPDAAPAAAAHPSGNTPLT